ncbi:hypothetical protein C4J93_2736 [Pseudomonas sp. R2-37-08W]|nr:hypothetical protein C4J93_2736 [Pseudomonas sp. R2-37-08W]
MVDIVLAVKAFCRSELAREKRPGNAFILDKRGGPDFFASKLAPTVT